MAVTTVEQAFRNHTDRQLEATYIFPLPKGANVNRFTMWVDGKEQTGECNPRHQAANTVRAPIVSADIRVQAMGQKQADPVENQDLSGYPSPGKMEDQGAGRELQR